VTAKLKSAKPVVAWARQSGTTSDNRHLAENHV
jgi:hypothetical protein